MKLISKDTAELFYGELLAASLQGDVFVQISRMRRVLEQAVQHCLAGELRVFSANSAKLLFVAYKYRLPAGLKNNLILSCQGLIEKNTGETGSALKDISGFVEFFSGIKAPESLARLFAERKNAAKLQGGGQKTSSFTRGSILETGEVMDEKAGRSFEIKMLAESLFGESCAPVEITVRVEESYEGKIRPDLIELHKMLWPFAMLNIFETDLLGGDGTLFKTKEKTLIILEPDFLIDVTDIAGCFVNYRPNPLIYLLSKLMPAKVGEAQLKGTIINDLLDNYIQEKQPDLEAVFRKSLEGNLLQAAAIGGEKIRDLWESVLFEHLDNIKKFTEEIEGENIVIEPSFFSPAYGIQGRLDILSSSSSQPNKFDIYELKSGSAPGGAALWQPHKMQVTLYNMLLRGAFGEKRYGTSAVFYSKIKDKPLRDHQSDFSDDKEIIKTRNQILWSIYSLSMGNFALLRRINPLDFGPYPVFKQEEIESFGKFYKGLSRQKTEYYHAFLAFCLRELVLSKVGGTFAEKTRELSSGRASLWLEDREIKQEKLSIIHSLELTESDTKAKTLSFSFTKKIEHNFRTGDMIILYEDGENEADKLSRNIFRGYIKHIGPEKLTIELRNLQPDDKTFTSALLWAIEADGFDSSIWQNVAQLYEFLSSESKFKKLLFFKQEPWQSDFKYGYRPSFTENQNKTIEAALKADDYFLLQGPPGTGKTSAALMEIVLQKLQKTRENMVILAFTNRAVQEICLKLKQNDIDFLRLSHNQAGEDDPTISKAAENRKINELRAFIASKRVFVSTIAGFASRMAYLKEIVNPDTLLIDEASQLIECQIVGILSNFSRVVLIGDQNQLPSVVVQDEIYSETKAKELNTIGLYDLRLSLFERLWNKTDGKNKAMLSTQFRMHDEIAGLVNPFYENRLVCGTQRQKEKKGSRVTFIPSALEATPKIHRQEAERAARLVRQYVGEGLSVGVITPWRAQVAAISREIGDEEILGKVTIDTVERFQGSEKDVIIVSMAVFSKGQLRQVESLTKDRTVDRKFNVMVSRAKKKLIILGYEPVLREAGFYSEILNKGRTAI